MKSNVTRKILPVLLEGMKISIESNGTVTVERDTEEQVRGSVERIVADKFSYDIENLTFRMSHLDFGENMYSDMYKYNKKKVL